MKCEVCKHSTSAARVFFDDYNFGPMCVGCINDSYDLKVSAVEAERIAIAIIEAGCTFGGVYNSRVLKLEYGEDVFYLNLPHPACTHEYDFTVPYHFHPFGFEDDFELDAVSTLAVFGKIIEIEEKSVA